jgi:hypothetical protein
VDRLNDFHLSLRNRKSFCERTSPKTHRRNSLMQNKSIKRKMPDVYREKTDNAADRCRRRS